MVSNEITSKKYSMKNPNKINVIFGRNGIGKSSLFRALDEEFTSSSEYGHIAYITPERGGSLFYQPHIADRAFKRGQIQSDRRKNQYGQFRDQTAARFQKLEINVLREIEAEKRDKDAFNHLIEKVNNLLDNVKLSRTKEVSFEIISKSQLKSIENQNIHNVISSGEAELITLAIEILCFMEECIEGKPNILFLDSPDVHLHPDAQYKFMRFLYDILSNDNSRCKTHVILCTHSTAILGALENHEFVSFDFMQELNQSNFDFKKISEAHRKILPIFGAHPLSNIYAEKPILLVEGEDDERIWQQAIKTSQGKLKLYPCVAGSKDLLHEYEKEASTLLSVIYDNAKGYSLRDRDETSDCIEDFENIQRFRLECQEAENLLLSDEVLKVLNIDFDELKNRIELWLQNNSLHKHYTDMKKFKDDNYDRKNSSVIKNIRNDLMSIINSNKPWEIAIGQTIGKIIKGEIFYDTNNNNSIVNYLGQQFFKEISGFKGDAQGK